MCPNCEVFYCKKCALSLSELENICWACNKPLDESKPVKSYKKDEEEIKLEMPENSPKFSKLNIEKPESK